MAPTMSLMLPSVWQMLHLVGDWGEKYWLAGKDRLAMWLIPFTGIDVEDRRTLQ
jgi:hypothetical protein